MLLGAAVGAKAECLRVLVLLEAHPATHRVDDLLVTVNTSVGVRLPATVGAAVIATGAIIEGLFEWHRLVARVALVTRA